MFEIFKDHNDSYFAEIITSEKQIKNKKNSLLKLKKLTEEEKDLMMKKNELLDIEEILKKRIIKEIDLKKSNISDLQAEIPKLKQRIENLAKLLEIPIIN